MLGVLLDNFRMGLGHPKAQTMIRSLELSATPMGRGDWLETELIVNHAYVKRPL